MKTLIPTISACLLSFIVYLCWIPSAQATPLPRWSIAIKGGFFAPSLSDWKRQYGARGDTRLGLDLGFKLTRRLEIGVEGGYFSDEGRAITVSGRPSGTDQTFKLFPLQSYLLYRLVFYQGQPLVPYLGGGYSHFTYRTELEGGDSVKGGQEGYHLRWGLALLLDWLDPSAAVLAYKDWGLVNSYLFVEAQYARVNDFGNSSINLGGWTYWGGLLLEF